MQPQPRQARPRVEPAVIRWALFGCAAAVMMPLIISGIGFLAAAIYSRDRIAAVIGAVMLVVPTVALVGAWMSGKRLANVARMRAEHPDEPWKWREDWAAGVIRENTSGNAGLWIFAIFWLAVSSPVLFFMKDKFRGDAFPLLLLPLFPLVGLLLLGVAVYQSLRQRKYGRSVCRLSRMPSEPGQALRGEIQARLAELPADGFKLRLSNVRRVKTTVGKTTTVSEETIWSEDRNVPAAAVGRSPEGMRLPFSFNLPSTVEGTDIRNPGTQIVWRLDVSGDVPGIDYAAKFDLPVFAKSHPGM